MVDQAEETPKIKTINYLANGGTGTMNSETVTVGQKWTVPACSFKAPTGKVFSHWAEDAKDSDTSKRYSAGSDVTFNNETAITYYAIWTVKLTIDTDVEKVLLYSATTEVDDLGFANPTKENKEFCVDFVAKSNPIAYTEEVVKTVKASM